MKQIICIDMDGVLCDFYGAFTKESSTALRWPQSRYGFFLNLDPIPGGVEVVNELRLKYDVCILTAPSVKNPLCYAEKRMWIEKHFDMDMVENLIITKRKNLVMGDFLIDDNLTGCGQENWAGELIHFGSDSYPDWDTVRKRFL